MTRIWRRAVCAFRVSALPARSGVFCFQGRMMAADFPAIASTSQREAEMREMKKVASHPKQAFPEFSLKS